MTAIDERGAPAVFVHWARAVVPLGDPAQCGATEGRATRIACAVTCPACRAWMEDRAWTGRNEVDSDPDAQSAAQIADERDQYASESAGLREQLAAATVVATEQASLIGALRAQLHAAGVAPVGQGWRIGVAA